MSERDEGKISLEEHFYLPSFEACGADGSALEGAAKAHNYQPEYFAAVQKRLGNDKLRLEEMDRCGIDLMVLSLTRAFRAYRIARLRSLPQSELTTIWRKLLRRIRSDLRASRLCRSRTYAPLATSWSGPSRNSVSRGH